MAGCGCGCGCGCVVVTGCVVVPGCVVVALSLWLWRYRCSCVAHVRACMCGAQAIPGVASSHRVLHLLLSLPTLPLSKSPLTWRTPLHYAACSGSVAAVEVVLKACVACACAAACAAACASQRATPTTPPQVHPRTPLQQHVLLHAGRCRSRTRQREGQAGRHAHCSGGDPGTPRRGEVSHGPRTLGAMVHASAATDAGLTVWCVVWCLLLCCLCLCTCAVYSCACAVLLCLCYCACAVYLCTCAVYLCLLVGTAGC